MEQCRLFVTGVDEGAEEVGAEEVGEEGVEGGVQFATHSAPRPRQEQS